MKRKYYVGAAVAAAGLLMAAFLLWPRESKAVAAAREAAAAGAAIDFAALRRENADIYGWLYIPGAEISEPLLQRSDDSLYYLAHNCVGARDEVGALFTESAYNDKGFTDAATVIYGKSAVRERLFGRLQEEYSSLEGLKKNGDIIIFLPEKVLRYQAFAAAPFQNYHILHYFDFQNETRYRAFLQAVRSVKAIDANWYSEAAAVPADSLLILSTNRSGSADGIYLVLAKRLQDKSA